jgi:PAS domain-containing protein
MNKSPISFSGIVENTVAALVLLNKDGCITYLNSTAEQIFNQPTGVLIEKNICTVLHENIVPGFNELYRKAIATRQYLQQVIYHPPSGKWLEHYIHSSHIQ